jgi:hypothetical protein
LLLARAEPCRVDFGVGESAHPLCIAAQKTSRKQLSNSLSMVSRRWLPAVRQASGGQNRDALGSARNGLAYRLSQRMAALQRRGGASTLITIGTIRTLSQTTG